MFERAGLGSLIDNTHPFEHIDDALARVRRQHAARPTLAPATEDHYLEEPVTN